MYVSFAELGSVVLDFDSDQLDVQFLDETATSLDHFTIVKTPPVAVCGNGIPEPGEQCDDGNASDTDACVGACMNATCGDGFVRAGVEQCDDANASDTDACLGTCLSATCGDGFVQTGVEQCDDGNLSSGDGCTPSCVPDCAAAPRLDCRVAAVSILKVVYGADPSRNAIKWKWRRGPAVAVGDIGDPTAGAGYNLCFYPDLPGSGALAAAVLLGPASAWESRDEKGFAYRDSSAANAGVRDLRIGTAATGRSQVALRALGASIPAGLLPASSFTIQLVGTDLGGCWTSNFATGVASATSFKGKTLVP